MDSPGAPSVSKRTRASRPRVKTGCGNCRKRRIKCDEARPSCGGCVRSGWKCDGYPATIAKPAGATHTWAFPNNALSISSDSIPFRIPGSQKDRQMLHYFCSQGSLDISGFIRSKFWTQTVLQQSHHDPAVRQVLVALSSLHLDYITSDTPGHKAATADTLQQYGRGLKMLRKRLESISPDTTRIALICCILFYCFESTLGNSDLAIQHLDRGLSLLPPSMINPLTSSEPSGLEGIGDLFARLDLQATLFNDTRLPVLTLTSAEERCQGFIKSPELPFDSFHEAQQQGAKLQNWMFNLLIGNVQYKQTPSEYIPPDVLYERALLEEQSHIWLKKGKSLIAAAELSKQGLEYGMNILLVQHLALHMLLRSSLPDNNCVFSMSPNPAAEEILRLAEIVLKQTLERNAAAETAKNPRRNFSSETGIVAPLMFLAVKCADISITERAIYLLSLSQRQEGLYHTGAMVATFQHLIDVKQEREALTPVDMVTRPKSLEYWAEDILNGAPAGISEESRLIPLSLLPGAYYLNDTNGEHNLAI